MIRSHDRFASHKNDHEIKISNNALLGFNLMIKVSTSWSILLNKFDLMIVILISWKKWILIAWNSTSWSFPVFVNTPYLRDLFDIANLTYAINASPIQLFLQIPKSRLRFTDFSSTSSGRSVSKSKTRRFAKNIRSGSTNAKIKRQHNFWKLENFKKMLIF